MNEDGDSGVEITTGDLEELRGRGQPLQLIDVRELWEWEYNRIPGACHIPLVELAARSSEILASPDPIVFYCHHGMRSLQAAAWFRRQGRTDCRSLSGGIAAWADDTDSDMPRY